MWWCVGAWAWTLGQGHHLETPTVVQDPMFALRLESGSVFAVHDEEGQVSGWVFVGEGGLEVRPHDTRDAHVLANRLVGLLGWDPDRARGIGHGTPLETRVDGAVVLGAQAWNAVEAVTRPYHATRGMRLLEGRDDTEEEVVVLSDRRRDDHIARRWLEDRTRWMREVGVDPAGLIVADRWEEASGTGTPSRTVLSVRTDLDWGRYAGDRAQPRTTQPWLDIRVDPSGVLDLASRVVIGAHGGGHAWTVARDRFETGPRGLPQAPRRIDLRRAEVIARFDPEPGGLSMRLAAGSALELVAVGGATRHVVLDIPHEQQRAWSDMPPLPHGFEIVSIHSGDTPLPWVPVSLGNQVEDRGHRRTVAVQLPEVLEAGQSVVVHVQTFDRFRYAHLKTYDINNQEVMYSFGHSTGLVRVLPQVRSHASAPAPVEVRAGLAPLGLGRKHHVVLSHHEGPRHEDHAGRWVSGQATSSDLRLAAGDWHDEASRARDLGLGLHPLYGVSEYERMPEAVQQMLDLFDPALPPMPIEQLRIVEAARSPHAASIEVAPSLIAHHELQTYGQRASRLGGSRLAIGLHLQWWLPHDVRPSDALLPHAIASSYTLRGAAAVEGPRAAERALGQVRYDGGDATALGWVLGPALDLTAGDAGALFAAVQRLLDGQHPASWDGLADALEIVTGQPWDGYLLAWVHAGVAPRIRVDASYEDDLLTLTAESDLPFGHYAIPVRLGPRRDARLALIQMVDGRGEVQVRWPGGAPSISPDPYETLPVRQLVGPGRGTHTGRR